MRGQAARSSRTASHGGWELGLLFVPFGLARGDEIARPRSQQLRREIDFRCEAVDRVSLDDNVVHFADGFDLPYDVLGHANCFIETGALLIDFNYDTEPLPGRFPIAAGPLPLLQESRLNHFGKLMFQWLYCHVLLPGRSIPGISAELSLAGK